VGVAGAMIADVAYLDRAVANYLSNMDAIIQDQTFSQLAMPAQGLMPGTSDDETKLRSWWRWAPSASSPTTARTAPSPNTCQPGCAQAELILQVINKIINEIYHSIGLAGERTKEDNSQGIDNSSGVAKAYDFERVNALLASKADSLERIENKLARLVAKWNGEEKAIEKLERDARVNTPTTSTCAVSTTSSKSRPASAGGSARHDAPRAHKALVDKLFPQLKAELRDKMLAEIKSSWPPKLDPLEAGANGDPIKKAGNNRLANALVK
jgi:hypothetical protein